MGIPTARLRQMKTETTISSAGWAHYACAAVVTEEECAKADGLLSVCLCEKSVRQRIATHRCEASGVTIWAHNQDGSRLWAIVGALCLHGAQGVRVPSLLQIESFTKKERTKQ